VAVVAVAALLVGAGGVLPAGAGGSQVASPTPAAGPGAAGAAALDARVVELDAALVAVDRDLAGARERLAVGRAELAATVAGVEDAAGRRGRSLRDLRAYAVGAYVGGGDPAGRLGEAILAAEGFSADLEVRRVLAAEGSARVLDHDRRAALDVAASRERLEQAATAVTDHQQAVAGLSIRRSALAEERAATAAAAAEAARLEEERRRTEQEARARAAALTAAEAEARAAGVAGPAPVTSGVVPPRRVPDAVAAALGAEIPLTSLDAYWRGADHVAATRPGCPVDWALVAAVGKVETSHGTYGGAWPSADGAVLPAIVGIPLDGTGGTARILDTDGGWYDGDPVLDRAVGPMQFLPGTWRGFAVDGNGDGIGDPHNVYDAAAAAASYLCHNARGADVAAAHSSAVHGYNRSWAYVAKVLGHAARYRALGEAALAPVRPVEVTTPPAADPAARPAAG
jgi:membrane-bound lytic murein transglycosylase B